MASVLHTAINVPDKTPAINMPAEIHAITMPEMDVIFPTQTLMQ